jgi:putative transposase
MKNDLKKSNEQREAILEYGFPKNHCSMDTAESLPKNKGRLYQLKKTSLETNTQTSKSCPILGAVSTSKERTLKPYWNNACQELQSQLWLPHRIESHEQDSTSLNGSSNYTEDRSLFWKTQIKPTNPLIQRLSFPSLPVSSIPTTEKDRIIGTRKIRIYPKNESKWFDMLSLNRRAYNLTIELFKNNTENKKLNQTEIRKNVREQCRKEFNESDRGFASVVADEAVNAAFETLKNIIKKRKSKIPCDFQYKSRKNPKQSFIIQKLSKKGVMPQLLACHITEQKPDEAIGNMASVSFHNGRWFLNCKKHIKVTKNDIQVDCNKIVSIDQGIRKFATTFSPKEVNFYGENFLNSKILPLFKQLDVFLSQRKLIQNKLKDIKQWMTDRIRNIDRQINKIRNKISDLIHDLHKRICFDLTLNYDYIILPKYETSNMVKRDKRKLSKLFTRAMNSLSAYRFKSLLKHHCLKNGKQLLDSTEEYTSKTRSWNGIIDNKLGGKKIIKDDNFVVDRDINGARGIFLLALTR